MKIASRWKNTSLVSPRDLIDSLRFGVYRLFNLLQGCALIENFCLHLRYFTMPLSVDS